MIAAALAAAQDTGKGLPQFETESFTSQAFWTVISFAFLIFLLWKFVLPHINRLLDERTAKISAEICEAERARSEAEQILAEYQQRMAKIEADAASIIEAARHAADAAHHQAMQRLNEEIKKKKAIYLEEIAFAKKQAMRDIKEMAVDLTMLATAKLVTARISEAEAKEMVEESLRELSSETQPVP